MPSIFMNKIKYLRGWLCGAVSSPHITNLSFAKILERGRRLGEWRFYWRIQEDLRGFKGKPLKEYTRLKSFKMVCNMSFKYKNTSFNIKIQFLKFDYNHLFISCNIFNFLCGFVAQLWNIKKCMCRPTQGLDSWFFFICIYYIEFIPLKTFTPI